MDFLVEAVEDPLEVHPGADGPVDRERTDAQHALQFIQEFQRVLGGAVALVDEGENRDATSTADFKELLGLRLNALGGIDDHHHSIDGSEHAVGVFREILVPGGVQQIDGKALVFELENGGADGDATLAFQFHPVGGGGSLMLACGHRSGQVDGPTVKQQLLGEGGLPCIGVRNDGKGAATLDLFLQTHKAAKGSRIQAVNKRESPNGRGQAIPIRDWWGGLACSQRHTLRASETLHAWASQPRWVCGVSPSRISGSCPEQPSFQWACMELK